MRVQLMCSSMVAGLVLLSSAAFAYGNMSAEDRVVKMTKNLNLTSDQVNAVRPIIQDYKNRMEQLEQEKEQKLKAVLTTDQMTKMKQMKKER